MINSVRNAVLSIVNKNNYGYISPSDFNLFAANSQMEIYEEYFSNYNKVINSENARLSGVDYADIEQPIAEVLEYFLRTDYLSKVSANKFSMPTPTTTGYSPYMLLDVKCRPVVLDTGTNTSVVSNQLVDSTATFLSLDIIAGDIVTNTTTGTPLTTETPTPTSTLTPTPTPTSGYTGDGWLFYGPEGDSSPTPPFANGNAVFINQSGPITTYNPNYISGVLGLYFNTGTTLGTSYLTQFQGLDATGGTITISQGSNTVIYSGTSSQYTVGPGFIELDILSSAQMIQSASTAFVSGTTINVVTS